MGNNIESYKLFYEKSPLPYQTLDEKGCFIDVNPSWEKTLGYPKENVIGKHFSEFLHSDCLSCFQKNFDEFKRCGYVDEAHYKIKHKDGYYLDISFQGRIGYNEDGSFQQTCCVLKDITHEKKNAVQLHRLQKTESLTRMAGAIAHHFNNILAVAMGNLQLAKENMPKELDIYYNLTAAEQAAHRAAEMSKLLLVYLGQSQGIPEILNLSKLSSSHLEKLCFTMPRKAFLETKLNKKGPMINADRNQMEQIITALLTNAWEAMENNSYEKIVVATGTASVAEINDENRFPVDWKQTADHYACLEVTDYGKGMDEKTVGRIFDPFFSDKFTGRGLGLSVALGNIKNHKGCITVDSRPKHGSTFKVFLPLETESVLYSKEKKSARTQPSPTLTTILLVEDQSMVREMAQTMLEHFGYNVITAADGIEALKRFRENQTKIKLVISDLTMPRMNGWETLDAIRSIQRDIPFVLVSGYSAPQTRNDNRSNKPQAFLTKPYQMKTLKETIDRVLKKTLKN